MGRQGQVAGHAGGCLQQQGGAVKRMVASERQHVLAGSLLAPVEQTQVLLLSSPIMSSDALTGVLSCG